MPNKTLIAIDDMTFESIVSTNKTLLSDWRANFSPVLLLSLFLVFSFAYPLKVAALDVQVTAATEEIEKTIAALPSTQRLEQLAPTANPQFWIRRLQLDGATALETLGYYNATVTTQVGKSNTLVVVVEEGQAVRISSITIQKNGRVATDLVATPLLNIGAPINHGKYEQTKRSIHRTLIEQGYPETRLITHQVQVDRQALTADITLAWDTGPQYKIGETRFENTQLLPEFLQRYAPYSIGDPLLESTLQTFNQRLRNSGYFRSVSVHSAISEANEQHEVPIVVRLETVKRSLYETGISAGTDRGPGLEASITRRRSGVRGRRWELKSEASLRRQYVAGRYELPSLKNRHKTHTVTANLVNEDTDGTDRRTARLGLSQQDLWRAWRHTYSLDLLDERFTIAGENTDSTLLIAGSNLFKRKTDDLVSPTKGWRLRIDSSLSSKALGSSTDFARLEISGKMVGSWNPKTRWLLRARTGLIESSSFENVPASLRYYSGGDNSVRGFDFQSLGPRDDLGNPLGGRGVAEVSVELDYLLTDRWRVALFVDGGKAYGSGTESTAYSAGAGIRWLSPIGPLRLDLALPLSDQESGVRVHFNAGPDL